ncbi:MAG: hypothetical protein WDW38_002897 [Sanguina aurantia]
MEPAIHAFIDHFPLHPTHPHTIPHSQATHSHHPQTDLCTKGSKADDTQHQRPGHGTVTDPTHASMPHLLTHCPSAQPILAPVTSPTPPKQRAQASTPPLLKCHPGSLPSPDQLLSGHEHSRSSNAPPPDAHQQATQGVHTHTKFNP